MDHRAAGNVFGLFRSRRSKDPFTAVDAFSVIETDAQFSSAVCFPAIENDSIPLGDFGVAAAQVAAKGGSSGDGNAGRIILFHFFRVDPQIL